MLYRSRIGSVGLLAIAIAVLMPACNTDPLGPSGQYQVENAADNFLFRMWNLEDANATYSYNWNNNGTQATVDITQGISAGSVLLIIEDANGTEVHRADVADDNDTDTSVGVAGSWTIELRLEGVTGSFDISVFKTN